MAWTSLSVESPAVESSAADSIQIWIASFLRYLELRLELLGLEAREAGVHLPWGWCALLLAAGLFVIGIVTGIIFTSRLRKPLFPVTLAEFQKDRQWLKQDTPDV